MGRVTKKAKGYLLLLGKGGILTLRRDGGGECRCDCLLLFSWKTE